MGLQSGRSGQSAACRLWSAPADVSKVSASGEATRCHRALLETPEDGRIKLYLTWRTLCFRQQHPDLFQQGEYLPLAVEGAKADRVIAFARKSETSTVLVVVPRLVAGLLNDIDVPPIGPRIWEDTHILIPFCSCSEKYRNVFTGEVLEVAQKRMVMKRLPSPKLWPTFP